MKKSIITHSILIALFLALLVMMGCEDKKPTEQGEIAGEDQILVTMIDQWDLYEYYTEELISRIERDSSSYPVLLEEYYMNVETHKIVIGGTEYSSESENIKSVHFIDNQIWTTDLDDIPSYLYDYFLNEENGALWLKEDTSSDTIYNVNPTLVDSVTVGPDSIVYYINIEDYQLLYKHGQGPKLDLQQPENNSIIPNNDIPDLSPTFEWEDYPEATEYIFQLTNDSLFNETTVFIYNDSLTNNEFVTPENLENYSNFYWRVNSDASDWSEIWNFGTFAIVELQEPSNNSNVGLKPTFMWENFDEATQYTIDISEDINFIDSVIIDSVTVNSFIPADNFESNTQYHWRVKADNTPDNWSYIRCFNTNKRVSPNIPEDEAAAIMLPVTFEWDGIDNTTMYSLNVSEDSTFASVNLIINEDITETEYTETGILEINKKYYWRVNSDVATNWSDTLSFMTNVAPILVSPEQDEDEVGLITQFTWEIFDNAEDYIIQVDTDNNFGNPLVTSVIYYDEDDAIVCETSSRIRENSNGTIDYIPLFVDDFESSTQYYWRVQRDNLEWSEVWSFTTITPAGQVELSTPENGSTNGEQLQSFNWSNFSDALFYRFELCYEETFSDTMWSNIITENTDYTLDEDDNEMLLLGETYYWRVRSDVSEWSDIWSFSVCGDIPFNIELTTNEQSPHKIDMTWTMNSGEFTAIHIERSEDEINWEEIAELADNNYADLGLVDSTTYFYRMRSENPMGFSDYSEPVSDTTFAFIFDNDPELIAVTAGLFDMGSTNGDIDEQPSFDHESFSPFPSDWTLDQNWSFISGVNSSLSFTSQDTLFDFELSAISPIISLPENVYKIYIQQYLSVLSAVDEIAEISVISNGDTTIVWSHSCVEGSWGETLDLSLQDYANQDIQLKFRIYGTATNNIEFWKIYDLRITTSFRTTTLENTFQIGKYEITNIEFCEVLNWALGKGNVLGIYSDNYNYSNDAFKFDNIIYGDNTCKVVFNDTDMIFEVEEGYENHPVDGVKWHGTAAYTNWLSEIKGYTGLYTGTTSISCDVYGTEGYRLPTEAEWEFAAIGGNSSLVEYLYSGSDNIDEVAWYFGNASQIQPIGGKIGNELELHDMSGNIWEWCNDVYDDYDPSQAVNPIGPGGNTGNTTHMVLRGGSWEYMAYHLRNTNRSNCKANLEYGKVTTSIGFRIAKINP